MAGGVFVNFRVSDEPYGAALIDRELVSRFGPDRVFRSSRSIRAGHDFVPALLNAVRACSAFVAVIGPAWLDAKDSTGRRRLDDAEDWVRKEIREALQTDALVIPVLLGDAERLTEKQLPEDIADLARLQFQRLDHRALDQSITALLDALVELVPDLAAAHVFAPPLVFSQDCLPSALLRAEYGIVPFHGREKDLEELTGWCQSKTPLSARVITGPGGQGKTRLANELCDELRSRWVAGALTEEVGAEAVAAIAGLRTPMLLVIDYAESRVGQLHALALALTARSSAQPVRLLLVARSVGPWLTRLRQHNDDMVSTLFRTMDEQWVPPLTPRTGERHAEFARAVSFLAAHLGKEARRILPPTGLEDPRYDRVLDLHAAALAALLDDPSSDADDVWRDPVARLLDHERRYWTRTAEAFALPDPHPARLDAVTAMATLFSANDLEEARKLLSALPTFRDQPVDVLDRYSNWARRLYPGPFTLNPLRPDRLGEDHVATVLAEQADVIDTCAAGASDHQVTQVLTVLGRAAPRHAHLDRAMSALLAADPDRYAAAAVSVAAGLEDARPLVGALTRTVTDSPDLDRLTALLDALPRSSRALAGFAAESSGLALDTHLRLPERDPLVTIRLLHQRSDHLADLGRYTEALDAITQAVELCRDWTADYGEEDALPVLAPVFETLAFRQGEVGHWDAALVASRKAVKINRRLVEGHPDAFLPWLAHSLYGLAAVHSRRYEAVLARPIITECVEILRPLVASYPGAFEPALASSLTVLANSMKGAGEEAASVAVAREAVEIWRRLAADRPDVHLSSLAITLTTFAKRLERAGSASEALPVAAEAASVLGRLTEEHRDRYLYSLAVALDYLANGLWAAGRHEDARVAAERAIELYDEYANEYPLVANPALASMLQTLGDRTADPQGSLPLIRRAVALYQELASDVGRDYRYRYTTAIADLVAHLARAGLEEEAVATVGTARAQCVLIAEAEEGWLAGYALNWLAKTLLTLGLVDLAVELLDDAREVAVREQHSQLAETLEATAAEAELNRGAPPQG